MKNLLTLILVLSTMVCFSQNSINFVDPDATWNVARTFPNANPQNPGFVETTTKVYGFIGDTLISNETWLKFYSTPDSNFMSDFTFLGNLKEENGIVLFLDTTNVTDTIYNFNLQTGDSVFYDFGWESNYLHIENIDSIEVSGQYYKRFYIEEPNYPPFYMEEVWIEGIGSVHGPLFPKYPGIFSYEIPDSLYLTCYKKDYSIIWNNPYYDNCYVNIILSTKESYTEAFKIFPNPVNDILTIKIPGSYSKQNKVSVFDMTGKLLLYKSFGHTDIFEINTTFLEIGFYLLQIENVNNTYRQKFIKK